MKEAQILLSFFLLITFCNIQPSFALESTATDIGTLGGYCAAGFINNQGQVSGNGYTQPAYPSPNHAFVWTKEGGMVDLTPSALGFSGPYAMNELGQIVGIDQSLPQKGFIWTPGDEGVTEIPGLGTVGPRDINNLGQVVGTDFGDPWEPRAFLWSPGEEMIYLDTLPDGWNSQAYAVNESGQVVGRIEGPGVGEAFSWTAEGGMVSLHPPGYLSSTAVAVNEVGQVLVMYHRSVENPKLRTFVWSEEGGAVDIGHLGGDYAYAIDINDLGQVLGYSVDENNKRTLFLWSVVEGMVPIGETLWTSNIAAINNLGQIAFTGSTDSGATTHAYVWTEQDGSQQLDELGVQSSAYAINDRGQVVGVTYYGTPNVAHATLWTFQTILPPDEQIDSIINSIEILIASDTLNQGQGNALISKLEAAKNQLDKDNETAVCNVLQAFNNQVQAYMNSDRLTLEEGQALIDEANAIISTLCG